MRALPDPLRGVTPAALPSSPGNEVLLDEIVATITPVLGGGVESFVPDMVDVVRVPAIRGAVRWWWRAMHPAWSVDELRGRERALWGGVGQGEEETRASRVRVTVQVTKRGLVVPAGRHVARPGGGLKALPEWAGGREYGYALFPLAEPTEERSRWSRHRASDMPTKSWRKDLEFRLRVEVSALSGDERKDLRNAFEAWLTLGGYGARTRRGFGALHAGRVSPDSVREALVAFSKLEAARQDRPTLAGCVMLEGSPQPRAEDAHRELLRAIQVFRQGTPFGRNPGHGKPFGRSNWPEADSLRALAGTWEPRHRPRGVTAGTGYAPRAAFGLPLQFQFKDRGDEPAGGILAPEGSETQRWASPVLLRVTQHRDRFVPTVLILAGHRPKKVRVEQQKGALVNRLPVANDGTRKGAQPPVEGALRAAGWDTLKAFGKWLCRDRGYVCKAGIL